MTKSQILKARQLLGLNQTEFAKLLGWTSSRNVINLELGHKEIQPQTVLAIECLLRRGDLLNKFK